jgi:hypothetical protein
MSFQLLIDFGFCSLEYSSLHFTTLTLIHSTILLLSDRDLQKCTIRVCVWTVSFCFFLNSTLSLLHSTVTILKTEKKIEERF